MGRLSGKRAVITGGSNGIGSAIAEAFAREGADVFFTTRTDEAAADQLVRRGEELGARMAFMRLDTSDLSNVAGLFEASIAFHGQVDLLVNNAGTTTRTRFLEITPDQYSTVLDVNLRFPFFATQMFARQMKEKGISGSIINISSISSTKAVSAMAHYQCSKAALSMLTKSAAYELARYGIRVNTISPGLTATKINRSQWHDDPPVWQFRSKDIPMGRTGLPSDHAGAAVFLASDESSWMTGADLVIDGGDSVI